MCGLAILSRAFSIVQRGHTPQTIAVPTSVVSESAVFSARREFFSKPLCRRTWSGWGRTKSALLSVFNLPAVAAVCRVYTGRGVRYTCSFARVRAHSVQATGQSVCFLRKTRGPDLDAMNLLHLSPYSVCKGLSLSPRKLVWCIGVLPQGIVDSCSLCYAQYRCLACELLAPRGVFFSELKGARREAW